MHGDYIFENPVTLPFLPTYGHSKDHRPDLKQFIIGTLCLDTNVPKEGRLGHSARDVLEAYKEPYGVEQNVRFLKDPVIVNSIYLKKSERIEALGLILLLSLLIWRLMERSMRQWVETRDEPLVGLDKKPTRRPTSDMMTTKFMPVMIVPFGEERWLASSMDEVQESYLKALGLAMAVFLQFELKKARDTT